MSLLGCLGDCLVVYVMSRGEDSEIGALDGVIEALVGGSTDSLISPPFPNGSDREA